MRKLIYFMTLTISVASLGFALVGCDDQDDKGDESKETEDEPTESSESTSEEEAGW